MSEIKCISVLFSQDGGREPYFGGLITLVLLVSPPFIFPLWFKTYQRPLCVAKSTMKLSEKQDQTS